MNRWLVIPLIYSLKQCQKESKPQMYIDSLNTFNRVTKLIKNE